MGLSKALTFRGSIATQILRNQHSDTVGISESFLENNLPAEDFLKHVNYLINVHFVLEDQILMPIFRPILREYLEFEEPIRIITGEHVSVRRLYGSIFEPVVLETDAEIKSTPEEVAGKADQIAKILLQHIYKEENGLFGMVDRYTPDTVKSELSSKMENMLLDLDGRFRYTQH